MSTSSKSGDLQDAEPATCSEPAVSGTEAVTTKRKRSLSPQNCRNFIRRQTASAMPEIVETFVEQARKGSVPHFASLAKVGGFDQRSGASEAPKRKRKSLARQLLEEVEEYEANQAAELAASNASQLDNHSPQEKP